MNSRLPAAPLRMWQSLTTAGRWRLLLALAAAGLAIWLIASPKPWVVAAGLKGKMDTLDYVRIYGWIAGALNLLVLGGLAVLCPWWSRPLETVSLPRRVTPAWLWAFVALAMGVTVFYSVPRLGQGFWDDEDLNVRTSLYGRFKQDPQTGEARFVKFTWLETIYSYKKGPNSHTLFTVLSRACAEAWNAVHPPRGLPFTEWPFRIPALVFGVLAVAAIAWMLADFGLPWAGVTAAFLLAMHPWHIRYASEARGYSAVVCLIPFFFVFWRRALVTGAWKWWAGFAAAEFALIYCYPGVLFLVAVMNVAAVAVFLFGPGGPAPRLTQAGRWFCVNALAAVAAIQLMLPLYPQGKAYFDFVSSQGFTAGWMWLVNTVSFMLGGAPWTKSGEPAAGYPEWLARYLDHPALVGFLALLAVGFIAAGAARLIGRGWPSAMLVAVTFLCPPITFLLAEIKKFLLYECYIIYSLPGLVACAAAGMTWLAGSMRKLPGGRVLAPAAIFLLLAGYFGSTGGFRDWIAHHPLQQFPESVMLCRGTLDPAECTNRKVLTASFCIPPYLYDAHMDRLDSMADFVGELHRADHENLPLFLNIGMPWAARHHNPQMWAVFSDPRLFDAPIRLRGFEPSLDRLVARYKPHSADTFDFSSCSMGER